jgi:predicted amidohydrolase
VKNLTLLVIITSLFASNCCWAETLEASSNKNKDAALDKNVEQPEARYVRIGHYQCYIEDGDFEKNLQTVINGLELAKEAHLDIVSFPESMLTGYFDSEKGARENSFAIDSPQIKKVLQKTSKYDIVFMVGFNELRGEKLYNTVVVIKKGKILGKYAKAFPCFDYFEPGREFPVFEEKGLKFGIIICADGGYIEPSRILMLKGARLIFAPHYNYVSEPLEHNEMVKHDHVARAVENGIYFVRANNYLKPDQKSKGLRYDALGYGDSYVINPLGTKVASAGLYNEYLMIYNFDLKLHPSPRNESIVSAKALLDVFKEELEKK